MSLERNSDLARRAAVHAALADPARLAITDTLLAGDASPSELAAMLAMPSNLLAHHLHVLEQAGVITRRRSEGDRRRTYLRLIPGALDPLTAPPARTAGRVLFVCTANSARSHLAAEFLAGQVAHRDHQIALALDVADVLGPQPGQRQPVAPGGRDRAGVDREPGMGSGRCRRDGAGPAPQRGG